MWRTRTIVWRKLTLSSMKIPHMYRWQLHLLSRLGFISYPIISGLKYTPRVALYWIYIRIVVGLKKKNGVECFALCRLCKDVGCHWRTLDALKTSKLPEKPFWSTTNCIQSGLSAFLGWWFYHFLRYLKKVWPWIGWKMQRYMSVEGPLNCQKEMAFLIECQLHIFHPKISRTKRSYWFSGTYEAPSRIHQIVLLMFGINASWGKSMVWPWHLWYRGTFALNSDSELWQRWLSTFVFFVRSQSGARVNSPTHVETQRNLHSVGCLTSKGG